MSLTGRPVRDRERPSPVVADERASTTNGFISHLAISTNLRGRIRVVLTVDVGRVLQSLPSLSIKVDVGLGGMPAGDDRDTFAN
jgi:hypothetical protein